MSSEPGLSPVPAEFSRLCQEGNWSKNSRMRLLVGLLVGLGVGVAGAILFLQSLPPEEGSAEERAEVAETALKKAEAKIAKLEAETGGSRRRSSAFAVEARSIGEDIRDGKPVDLDRVFRAAKPWLRDLGPIFDRIRVRDQKRHFDTLAGEFAREYGLSESQQENLKTWLEMKAEENSRQFSEVVNSETSGLEDMIRASRRWSRVEGLDDFMELTLKGEALTKYREKRLTERMENVQREADRKVTRLDRIIELDESQKDQVFVIVAQSAEDYDPSMQFEGLTGETTSWTPGQDREDTIRSVLRPDQLAAYEEHRRARLEEAQRELNEIGLALPEDWDFLDDDDL